MVLTIALELQPISFATSFIILRCGASQGKEGQFINNELSGNSAYSACDWSV